MLSNESQLFTSTKADLRSLVEKYDNFVLDVWGVLYDGANPLPGAVEFIEYLKKRNKKFCVLSNAPRPGSFVHERLSKIGFNIEKELITTSGDFFLSKIQEFRDDKFYVLGEDLNKDLLRGITIKRTGSLEEAKYLLVLLFADSLSEFEASDKVLKMAAERKLIFVCPNPDVVVYHQNNIRFTSGAFADKYTKLGGKVLYFGKPYVDIYAHIFNKYGFEKRNTLMVGDSLETDIKGAHNYHFDSLMLLTGVHKEGELESLFLQYNLQPTYILVNLELENAKANIGQ